jgi:hypothetical protein
MKQKEIDWRASETNLNKDINHKQILIINLQDRIKKNDQEQEKAYTKISKANKPLADEQVTKFK